MGYGTIKSLGTTGLDEWWRCCAGKGVVCQAVALECLSIWVILALDCKHYTLSIQESVYVGSSCHQHVLMPPLCGIQLHCPKQTYLVYFWSLVMAELRKEGERDIENRRVCIFIAILRISFMQPSNFWCFCKEYYALGNVGLNHSPMCSYSGSPWLYMYTTYSSCSPSPDGVSFFPLPRGLCCCWGSVPTSPPIGQHFHDYFMTSLRCAWERAGPINIRQAASIKTW